MPQALIIENPARGPGGPGPRSGHQAGTKGSARPFERVGRGQLRRKARSAIWPVGQAVKTPASHAGNAGSIPARVTKRMDLGREAGFRYMAKRLNAAKH